MVKKHNLGDKYTDELIKERAEAKGYTVRDIVREGKIPFVHMQCKCGALRIVSVPDIRHAVCPFCMTTKKRKTYNDVINKIKEIGFIYLDGLTIKEDKYGNEFVGIGDRFSLQCASGHSRTMTVSELYEGKNCAVCTGTHSNIGFSRGEDIISKVLLHNDIEFIRQYKIIDKYNGLPVDFYLPKHNLVIEYDGKQHKYGRSDDKSKTPEYMKSRDELKDDVLRRKGINILRIDGEYCRGKQIVFKLKDKLSFLYNINPYDTTYDTMVKETTDKCHELYGWKSYDSFKADAELWKNYTKEELRKMEGVSWSMTVKAFHYIYGVSKSKLVK